MKLTIHGYSTARFSTWYFVEELGLLLDAGDGLVANLLGKTGKIRNVFISHADRDHLGGLLQFNQVSHSSPNVYFPKDASSFRFLEDFAKRFDPHAVQSNWFPLENHQAIQIKQNYEVRAFENQHISVKDQLKSLSYKVVSLKAKLKKEFLGLSKDEILSIKDQKGNEHLNEIVEKNVLIYSGDTPVFDYSKFDHCEVLIHEATFLSKSELKIHNNKNKHSSLEEVMKMISEINVEKLILGHFSSRYDQEVIDQEIRRFIKEYQIKIPVYRIPIGKYARNILDGNALN